MPSDAHPVYEFGEFRLDPRRRQLVRISEGTSVAVKPKAFDALVFLVEHAGELVTREALSKALWPSTIVEENNLTQAVAALRRVLGDGHVTTVPGRGYQFVAEVRRSALESARGADPPSAPDSKPAVRVERQAPDAVPEPPPVAARPRALRRAAVLACVAVLLASAFLLFHVVGWPPERGDDDPLRLAAFKRLTDFDGVEEHAAISRDGRFVAFVSDRDGDWDAWVGQIDSANFRNMTAGAVAELRNAAVRTLGFTPDGLLVTLWTKRQNPTGAGIVDGGWAIPTIGGDLQPYLPGVAELDWSPDGRRVVYHTSDRGDPLFVTAMHDAAPRQIYVAPGALHSHFPLWSRDGEFVYFVRGQPRDEMDLWRIRATGGKPERLTFQNSRVSFPTWLNDRTLLYLATDRDGSGPWIHALDVETRKSRRLNTTGVEYTSLAASADGRRLVATAARSTGTLWRLALGKATDGTADPAPMAGRAPRGVSPRLGDRRVVYRAPRPGASADGIWQLRDEVETELWSGTNGRVVAGPALAPDGRIAFAVQGQSITSLYVMEADGGAPREVSGDLDVRGAAAWSPDGKWLAIAAIRGSEPRLVKLPVDGGAPVQLGDVYALDPVWSPSGAFLVYSGADVGTNFPIGAVNADGSPHAIANLMLTRGSRRMNFFGGDDSLVILKGNMAHKEFWVVDLESGEARRLAAVGAGPIVTDFDVASDGREIVFDRIRDASDIVLIEFASR